MPLILAFFLVCFFLMALPAFGQGVTILARAWIAAAQKPLFWTGALLVVFSGWWAHWDSPFWVCATLLALAGLFISTVAKLTERL